LEDGLWISALFNDIQEKVETVDDSMILIQNHRLKMTRALADVVMLDLNQKKSVTTRHVKIMKIITPADEGLTSLMLVQLYLSNHHSQLVFAASFIQVGRAITRWFEVLSIIRTCIRCAMRMTVKE